MNFRLFKIFTILVSFLFLTGFTPFVSILGPGVTVLTSGNIYNSFCYYSDFFIYNEIINLFTVKSGNSDLCKRLYIFIAGNNNTIYTLTSS